MAPRIPQYDELMWPALTALKSLGGSATVREMYERVVEDEGFTEEQQSVFTKDGRMPQIQYRLHWARTHLKGIGAVENSARGVWAITDKGRSLSAEEVRDQVKSWRAGLRTRDGAAGTPADDADDLDDDKVSWQELLLMRLLEIPPAGFERLAQRLLREAGFTNVSVTGKSGDGGIDGVGTYRLSLVSFPIYFQCKRYRGTVPSRDVRDFRGAMAGRGDKGLFITTGSFTRDAQHEAARDGAPPIELIDGEQLCDLLKQYGLGVNVTLRTVEDVAVDPRFFDDYH
jgi:restriction system protein